MPPDVIVDEIDAAPSAEFDEWMRRVLAMLEARLGPIGLD